MTGYKMYKKHIIKVISFLFVLYIAGSPILSTIQAEEKPVIAVYDLKGLNMSEMDAAGITEFVRTALINTKYFNVVEKANMERILSETAFQQTGCTADECAVQIGKILNVKKILVGSVQKTLGKYYINVRFVDVETALNEFAKVVEAKTESDILTISDDLAKAIVAELKGKPATAAVIPAPKDTKKKEDGKKEVGKGMLYITGLVEGREVAADIIIDGNKLEAKAPYLVKEIKEGNHKIVLKYNEYSGREDVEIQKDEISKVNISLEALKGKILVSTLPANASVLLDGEMIGTTPARKNDVTFGKHKVKIEKDYYFPVEKEITVNSGDLFTFDYTLEAFGILKISTEPEGAKVRINGEDKGLTPFKGRFKDGKYGILIAKENYQEINLEEDIKNGELKELSRKLEYNREYFETAKLEQKASRAGFLRKSGIILTSLSAAAVVLGIVMGESNFTKYSNAANEADAVNYRAQVEKWDTVRNISGGMAAGGGIIIIASYKF